MLGRAGREVLGPAPGCVARESLMETREEEEEEGRGWGGRKPLCDTAKWPPCGSCMLPPPGRVAG